MRESNYWLRLLSEIDGTESEITHLIMESTELKNILGSISSKVVKIKDEP